MGDTYLARGRCVSGSTGDSSLGRGGGGDAHLVPRETHRSGEEVGRHGALCRREDRFDARRVDDAACVHA